MPDRVQFLLTSRAATKAFAGITGSSRDTEIDYLLYSVSASIERYLNRGVERFERTETYDVDPGQRVWALGAYPVTATSSVSHDSNRSFGSGTAIATADYDVDTELGLVRLDYDLPPGRGYLRVVYTGGMAASLQALRSYYPEVELACQVQIKEILHRQTVGFGPGMSVSEGGASVSWPAAELSPEVKRMLDHLRRWVIG